MKLAQIALLLILSVLAVQASAFPETWAYLMKGEEKYFPASSPITDVACFSAAVDGDGNLKGGHLRPPELPGARAGTRYHLVVTIPWNSTLAHIYFNPELPFRDRIIAGIVERSNAFDGLQIDFESIAKEDGTAFLNFLAAVKKALPKGKIFSVAVMARWEEHKQMNPADAFDYPFIGMIADRVVVMAYDEHYSGGTHGPVASLPWCEKIYAYATKTIDPGKLVMGLPLYGRGWQTPSLAHSYKNREILIELRNKDIQPSNDWKTGGSYSFTETVTIDVHYETFQSLTAKLDLYGRRPIRGVAFWRIGQEPEGFWSAWSH
jgi:spore germination protein YaaH